MRVLKLFLFLSFSASFCSQDSLKIISWNLHLLPAPVFAKSKKKLRVDSIANHFTVNDTSVDILLFQEVFHKKRRNQLIQGLDQLYPYHTPVINSAKGKPFKTNSGLIIFSKTPFVQMSSIKYEDCSGSDCIAFKGAQFIHTVWNNVPLLIVNTHLNSEPPRSIALEQADQIISQLIKPYLNTKTPIIIGGDFNINCADSSNYEKLLSIVGSDNEFHKNNVQQEKPKALKNTLDYLFLFNDWLPSHFQLKYVHKCLIGPSWKEDNKRKVYGETVGFSDHHAVIMKLVFTP